MFTMLAALESGRPLDTGFVAPGRFVTRFPADGPGQLRRPVVPGQRHPEWMDGYRTMWTGFGRSVNTYFAWLTEQIGADRVVEMAERLGIPFRAPDDAELARHGAAQLGGVHPRGVLHHPARPGQRVRHGRRRGDLVRAAAGRVDQGHRR